MQANELSSSRCLMKFLIGLATITNIKPSVSNDNIFVLSPMAKEIRYQ